MYRRECNALSNPEQYPRRDQGHRSRRRRLGQDEGEERPEGDPSCQHALPAEAVRELTSEDLGERVAEEERGEHEALEGLRM